MEIGTFATPIFYDTDFASSDANAPIKVEPRQKEESKEEPVPLVAGMFTGDMGIDSYLAEN